ncbi:MAG: DNA mismatch repair endonuclease MutL [Proteobacteria bacterium]|nr:DNA mismatch repair endonuclease MutL [Pseudomonadota bacterium]MCP4915745.1 DNA mismatch repair endonuclease MutL [Pseudomonadota bacterium]
MGRIRILEDHLVNKIAAGEVVERPASVVKELVENALDAGATRIQVRLESGGRKLIEIVDNGHGMDKSDVLMCIERHGTSKIRTEKDLFEVGTLGFRGEAIPSIASVSRLELQSRVEGEEVGTQVVLNGGKMRPPEPVACPVGTRFRVRTLFFNVPVRRKFLRTVQTELSHCVETVLREAMIRPEVDFTVEHDGRVLVRAPRVDSWKARAADLLKSHGQALVPVSFSNGDLEVTALISPVGVHRGSAQGSQYLYVNGRYVRDATMRRAINEAYRAIVPKGRYPVVVLEVRVPNDHVDVNIHPSKTEVRFRFNRDLFSAVSQGLREGLMEHGIRRPVADEKRYQPRVEAPVPNETLPLTPPPRPAPAVFPPPSSPILERAEPTWTPDSDAPPPSLAPPRFDEVAPNAMLAVPRFQDLRVIGQFADTYILCEGGGELVIVDQHAAHERITLYRYQMQRDDKLGAAQRLLHPIIVDMPASRAQALAQELDVLRELHLEVEDYGGGSFAVTAVPAGLAEKDVPGVLVDVADDLVDGGRGLAGRDLADHVLSTMACHNSIRANHRLSLYEMRELLRALDGVDFSVCAHGRPVVIRVDQKELELRFHRA